MKHSLKNSFLVPTLVSFVSCRKDTKKMLSLSLTAAGLFALSSCMKIETDRPDPINEAKQETPRVQFIPSVDICLHNSTTIDGNDTIFSRNGVYVTKPSFYALQGSIAEDVTRITCAPCPELIAANAGKARALENLPLIGPLLPH